MLDSQGKRLPGPGVKAGLKKLIGREIKKSNEKPKIMKSLTKPSESKASAKNSMNKRSNIRSLDSSEKFKSVSASLNQQGSDKPAPKLKPNVMKPETNLSKSINPKTEAALSSGTIGSRFSVKLKPSTIVLPSKATPRLSSLEKISSTQMKPPSVAPSQPSVTNTQVQSQFSRLQPTRFQSRMCPPASTKAAGATQAHLRPGQPGSSGIRPSSVRAAPSGIARLAGRHSLSASRLPLPGKFS